jgi:hypothetical protein
MLWNTAFEHTQTENFGPEAKNWLLSVQEAILVGLTHVLRALLLPPSPVHPPIANPYPRPNGGEYPIAEIGVESLLWRTELDKAITRDVGDILLLRTKLPALPCNEVRVHIC